MSERAGIIAETRHYAVCPSCLEKAGSVDHLLGGNHKVQWHCHACGRAYRIAFTEDGGAAVEKAPEIGIYEKTHVLLRAGDIGLVVEWTRLLEAGQPLGQGGEPPGARYFFNEHTCPTNYMKHVVRVIDLKNQDSDPHGIFQYVKTVPFQGGGYAWKDDVNDAGEMRKLMELFDYKPECAETNCQKKIEAALAEGRSQCDEAILEAMELAVKDFE
jgi:hypothetical protein